MLPFDIDPPGGERYALLGKVVTMDDAYRVLNQGAVYVAAGQIVAVQPKSAPPPPGFEHSPRLETGGTLYPGLIELHNHLSYNALPLWEVPRRFTNRGQWGGVPDYRRLISGPMAILGRSPGYVEALVRYVEAKCLLGGVTTSQGVALFSNSGIQKYYRGAVRNVEKTEDPALPEALSRIADVDAASAERFLERLRRSSCLLLHLSEGIDDRARAHFQALQLADGTWAITDALVGIHSAGLREEDFGVMQRHGGAMVWSPLSNLLLYGQTAAIRAARDSGIPIALGSDWSPSGSKNLLGELKVARLVSQEAGGVFSDRELVAMATRNPARILKWGALGTLEAGKRADLLVLDGKFGDPYARLLTSSEKAVALVVINGVPRYGRTSLMRHFGPGTEPWTVARSRRTLNLAQETADPVVGALSLREARDRLRQGLLRLRELALALEQPPAGPAVLDAPEEQWYLLLDHNEVPGEAQRPHLPFGEEGELTGLLSSVAATVPLSELVGPIALDPLTVADDPGFLDRLRQQQNLPAYVKDGLPGLYR
jgi:5-methylthioadenosine/S-adenosylhomocysteine deaminase